MECPRSPVFNTSVAQKRHAQNVAKAKRLGTPKLRDLLREKCRIRIRDARQHCLDNNRCMPLSELGEILRLELNELELDLAMEQQVYEELLADINEWYAMEMENEEQLAAAAEAEPGMPLCPVCLLKPLQRLAAKAAYKCECGIQFDYAGDMAQLKKILQSKIETHEANCTQALRFFIEPASTHLDAICGSCEYFCTI